jgi:hypothetical protein
MLMRMKYLIACAAVALAAPAFADPITLTGNYLKVGVSDYGTLGSDGNTSPGILHDPTGTGDFSSNNDYLTPGTPHEGFSVNSATFGYSQNDNDGYSDFGTGSPTLLTGAAAMGYANAATWTGSNGSLQITNSYFFNPGDQRILVTTTLTALSDIASLAFSRSLDPDPDVNTYGSFATNNQRGNSLYGVTDFVGAAGPATGLTIGLLNLSGDTYTHNTEIGSGDCCNNRDPFEVLTGGTYDSTSADDSINLAWYVGDLTTGQSATLTYAYVVGANIQTVGGAVPEPASWAMMLGGFGVIGGALRRRSARTLTA